MDVRCLDANKDYIIVTWKQPAVDGGNSILGYFVDRSGGVLTPVTLQCLSCVLQYLSKVCDILRLSVGDLIIVMSFLYLKNCE